MQSEKSIEEYLVRSVKSAGGLALKLAVPGEAHWPDRLIVLDDVVAFVEVKRPGGRLSPGQRVRIAQLENRNAPVYVVWNKEEVDVLIQRLAPVSTARS